MLILFGFPFLQPAVKGLLDGVTAYFHLKGECERQKELALEARSKLRVRFDILLFLLLVSLS